MNRKRGLDDKTMFAWRPAPFGRARRVPAAEARRWRELGAYAVYPRRCPSRRDWTYEEVSRLVTLLDEGHGYDACAQKLGRTRYAVYIKAKRMRCVMSKRPTLLNAREIARLLGKGGCERSVARWITGGLLPGRAAISGTRRIWRVRWDDLMAFLRDERFWPCWNAARIADDDLRAEMLALRAHEGAYLTQRQVADCYCVTVAAVGQWLERGWLPYVHSGGGNTQLAQIDSRARADGEPMFTISASDRAKKSAAAYLLDGDNARADDRLATVRAGVEPAMTVRGSRTSASRAYVGRWVRLTIQALGRFQTVPDSYIGLTAEINGNGVPCLLAQRMMESLR